jgi:hypothetical protein
VEQPIEGTRIAEGVFTYSVDDRPQGAEMWRLTQIDPDHLHCQALFVHNQQPLYGMELIAAPDGRPEQIDARLHRPDNERRAHLEFSAGAARGAITTPTESHPIDLQLPTDAVTFPEAIALRSWLGQRIDFTTDAEQTLNLCAIPVLTAPEQALLPRSVTARITVLGPETVELLMAEVQATRVIIEMPGHVPHHAWFDVHRFPVQWYWVAPDNSGASVEHAYSLTRYSR